MPRRLRGNQAELAGRQDGARVQVWRNCGQGVRSMCASLFPAALLSVVLVEEGSLTVSAFFPALTVLVCGQGRESRLVPARQGAFSLVASSLSTFFWARSCLVILTFAVVVPIWLFLRVCLVGWGAADGGRV